MPREILCARWLLIFQLTLGKHMECMLAKMSYQRYMSNMFYVGATLRQHVCPTTAQRVNLRWANVVCQRWANGVANQNTPLTQRYHVSGNLPGQISMST